MSGQGFDLDSFLTCPVLGILRGIPLDKVEPVLDTVCDAGLSHIEVTLNTSDAFSILKKIASLYQGGLTLGAGTVLTLDQAQQALDAGATFLVSPTLNEEVALFCNRKKVAYFPGAYTPTEIERAWNAGATMVKVFPASQLGPVFFKEVRGPFADIRMMAVGGVRADNAHEYLKSGAQAVAVGGSVFSTERMLMENTESIHRDLSDILIAVREFFTKMAM